MQGKAFAQVDPARLKNSPSFLLAPAPKRHCVEIPVLTLGVDTVGPRLSLVSLLPLSPPLAHQMPT